MTSEENFSSISLFEQRDILKLLILLEDKDMEKRERWVKRLEAVKANIENMKWLDNPNKYT